MTREDAKAILKDCLYKAEYKHGAYGIALEMAIKALEQKDWKFYYDHGYAQAKRDLQEPKTETWSIKDVTNTFKKYGLIKEQESVLDKIRGEIVHLHDWAFSREEILRIIDKYMSESESGDDNKG
jgi:hypothetical protein